MIEITKLSIMITVYKDISFKQNPFVISYEEYKEAEKCEKPGK